MLVYFSEGIHEVGAVLRLWYTGYHSEINDLIVLCCVGPVTGWLP
jgi:hypothetical protein